LDDDATPGGEGAKPPRAEPGQPRRVGELADHQAPDLGVQQARHPPGKAGEGAVDLAEQLVLGRGAHVDPARAVGHQGGQLDHGLIDIDVATLHAVPGQQQIADRHQVDRVGLDATLPAGAPLGGHVRRVQLDQLPVRRQHPSADKRAMVVPGRLDPDPDQAHRALGAHRLDPPHELGHARPGHGERERPHQQLTGEVADQRHRRVLADVDGDRDELVWGIPRVWATSCCTWAPWTCTMSTPPPGCVGRAHTSLCTSGGGLRRPRIYISG
jgi:hypothetical protein